MAPVTFTFEGPLPWSEDSLWPIARTLTSELGTHRLVKGIKDGTRQMWNVRADGEQIGTTVVERVTHKDGIREAFIWAYEGRRAVHFVHAMAIAARRNGCAQLGFYTHHRAAVRGFKCFSPVVSKTGIPGEMRFTFDTGRFAA